MKYQDVRKRLIKEAAILVVAISALGGGTYYATMMSEDYVQQKQVLDNEIAMISSQMNDLRTKYSKVQGNMELYEEIRTKNANNELAINRQASRKKFEIFKNRYFLNNLSLTVTPEMETTNPKLKNSSIVASDVQLSFEALTDEDVYELLGAIDKEMSGAVKITAMRLERTQKLTDEMLNTIAKTGKLPLIKGEMKLVWYGIKTVEPPAPQGQKPQ